MSWGIYAKKKSSPWNLWAKHYTSLPEPELVSTKLSFRVRLGWFDRDKNLPQKKTHQPLRSHVAINSDGNKAAPVWGCSDNGNLDRVDKKKCPCYEGTSCQKKTLVLKPPFLDVLMLTGWRISGVISFTLKMRVKFLIGFHLKLGGSIYIYIV